MKKDNHNPRRQLLVALPPSPHKSYNYMSVPIQELESVLERFYSSSGSNPQVEQYLQNLKNQPNALQVAQECLSNSQNQYVKWFGVVLIENWIQVKWNTTSTNDKVAIKNFLLDYVATRSIKTLPTFISNKLAKVIVDIAKHEWPHTYSDFMNNIQQLIMNSDTTAFGITLITLTGEEFITSTKEDLPARRRQELRELLLPQLPSILDKIHFILNSLYESNVRVEGTKCTTNFSNDSSNLCSITFGALLQLFSWIPLADLLSAKLWETIFNYIKLRDMHGILALSCVNEVMGKNFLPRHFDNFLRVVFQQVYSLLHLTTEVGTSNLDERFLEKLTQFVHLFISNHFHRIESSPDFPVLQLLELLYKFTVTQTSNDGYLATLEIWDVLLEYLLKKKEDKKDISNYQGLVALANLAIRYIHYTLNGERLSELSDDANENTETESELETVLISSIEIVAKVSELFCEPVLQLLQPLLMSNLEGFRSIAASLNNYSSNDDKASFTLNDVAIIFRLFGRLEEHFVEDLPSKYAGTFFVVQCCMDISRYLASSKLYLKGGSLTYLLTHCLGVLHGFTHWLASVESHLRTQPNTLPPNAQQEFTVLISSLVEHVGNLLSPEVPTPISLGAAQLLRSITTTIRPPGVLKLVEPLLLNLNAICSPLHVSVQCMVYVALSNAILMPSPSLPTAQQGWEERTVKYHQFIQGAVDEYQNIPATHGFVESKIYLQPDVMTRLLKLLKIFHAIVESNLHEGRAQKSVLFKSIQPTLNTTLGFFRIYLSHPQMLQSVLDYLLMVLDCLKIQVGLEFIKATLDTFMSLFTADQLANILSTSNSTGSNVICRLLEILGFLVQEPGNTFDSLLPSILSFTMDQVYPQVIHDNSSLEAKQTFFKLLYLMLSYKGKYLASPQNERLAAIVAAFNQSFQQPDITLYKQNLESLGTLQEKQKIYQLLYGTPLFTFLKSFFDTLLAKTHNLLRDDIINTIFQIAQVNFDTFYDQFVPQYLELFPKLRPEQKQQLRHALQGERDLPTFSFKMNQFLNDFIFYQAQ